MRVEAWIWDGCEYGHDCSILCEECTQRIIEVWDDIIIKYFVNAFNVTYCHPLSHDGLGVLVSSLGGVL